MDPGVVGSFRFVGDEAAATGLDETGFFFAFARGQQ